MASTSHTSEDAGEKTQKGGDEFAQLRQQLTQIRDGARNIVGHARGAAVSVLTSKTFQRGAISTALLVTGTVVLYGIAAVGYLVFYYAYLPDMVKEVPVHLQYGWGENPFGVVENVDFRARQRYEIGVELTLPKTAENGRKGNWMVVMHWLAEGQRSGQQQQQQDMREGIPGSGGGYYLLGSDEGDKTWGGGGLVTSFSLGGFVKGKKVLGTAARAAIVPYEDPMVSAAARLLFLPWHILFPKKAEAVTLKIGMAEGLRFERGETLPRTLVLELQAGQGLQVYSAKVVLVAQLSGLRYLMYRWRLTSFFAITSLLWAMEVVLMCVAALIMGYWLSAKSKEDWDGNDQELYEGGVVQKNQGFKKEEGMSDTERTFPTSSGQPPLKYESSPIETKIKKEEGEQESLFRAPDFGVDGDDEEDGEGSGFRDSGIGTSYSDAARRDGIARRRKVSSSNLSTS